MDRDSEPGHSDFPSDGRRSTLLPAAVAVLVFLGLPLVFVCMRNCGRKGSPFTRADARKLLAEQPALLAQIRSLADRDDDPTLRERLAHQIGALWIKRDERNALWVCFCGTGPPPQHYMLCWIPPADVERLERDEYSLGDSWEPLGEGWYWVSA